MNAELAERVASWPERLDEVKAWIAVQETTADLSALRLLAGRFAASRTEALRDAVAAGEVVVRCERRLGEIANTTVPRNQRGRAAQRRFDYQAARALRERGLSIPDTAARFGVGVEAIRKAEKQGWPPPKPMRLPFRRAFAEEVGAATWALSCWCRNADLDVDVFESLLQELTTANVIPTSTSIDARQRLRGAIIEDRIMRFPNGRLAYRIRGGRWHSLKGDRRCDIEAAREALKRSEGRIKASRRSVPTEGHLAHLYEALDHARRLIAAAHLDDGQRAILEEANVTYSHLDDLAKAVVRAA